MPHKNIPPISQNFYIDERRFVYFKLENQKKDNVLTLEQLNRFVVDVTGICKNYYMHFLVDLRCATGVASYNSFKLLSKDIQLSSACSKIAFIANTLPLKVLIYNYRKIH